METDLVIRKNINDVYAMKLSILKEYEKLEAADIKIKDLFEGVNSHSFHRLDFNSNSFSENRNEKEIDKRCWFYLVKIYQLNKYMLCTEYEKMTSQIEKYDFPVFNLDNAETWLDGLKGLVYESVRKLIEDVYGRITEKTYPTGSGWDKTEKKRNNNGIDKHFILTTYDHNAITWYSQRPTITDDLEKACYIIDGKSVPECTIKENLRKGKQYEGENDYFRIKICLNGNTHYWIKDEIRNKLNFYGAKRGVISDGVKIKIFEKGWRHAQAASA